ncbi:hypothetical protein SAMN06265222_108134 [Neorhodopirellula lusitana]|uniref:Uncharacterized protein n=1 Tax=Neorhodopirellula lusitana TaxID=445327 RepID=A0ABY1QA54_9BACT|nr:hypothetical protein SAMN06265222_108134 [Neorhodopirellula lusitana]
MRNRGFTGAIQNVGPGLTPVLSGEIGLAQIELPGRHAVLAEQAGPGESPSPRKQFQQSRLPWYLGLPGRARRRDEFGKLPVSAKRPTAVSV